MQNQNFQLGSINPVLKPVQELMELNVKTIQSLTYMNPLDFININKPEELLQKNVELMIRNTHVILDYVQHIFRVLEKNTSRNSNFFEGQVSASTQPVKQSTPSVKSHIVKTKKKSASVSKSKGTVKRASSIAKLPVKKAVSLVTNVSGKKTIKRVSSPVKAVQLNKSASSISSKSRSSVKKATSKSGKMVQKRAPVVAKDSGKNKLVSVKPSMAKPVSKNMVKLSAQAKH